MVRLIRITAGPAISRQNQVEHMAKVAFLGLGVMGFRWPAHSVTKGGHEVTG